ncbi:MAG: glycoside hydrolase family 2 TIM barrel-domain containing protein [Nakamurella sp.]
MSLNGPWQFTVHASDPVDAGIPAFACADFDTTGWSAISVPGHWVLQGHGSPIYTNVRYPFPIDPPYVPDENPTGDYRLVFTVPSDVAATERVRLRFDGVESLATVWLNGEEIGWFTGSRLPTEFDVTDHFVAGDNVLAVRVNQWSAASYLEDQDQWWLPGIFRDVTLLGRPAGGVEDADVTADFDPDTGTGTLTVEVIGTYPVTVSLPELGLTQTWSGPGDAAPLQVGVVQAWSAETPRIYDLTLASPGETVALRVGFRRIEIIRDRLLVNGRPLTFRGVNRHESHPDLGRVFDEAFVVRDLHLMKRHHINAIRFAHQPPHPRNLELCDELGFWVVGECDLETHGFSDIDWQDNPSDDPQWRPALLDRIARTVERDKNHPCVVLWSLGNESGTGRNLAEMAAWVHDRDPSRPVHYEGDYDGAYTDVYSRMYPTLEEIRSLCDQQTMPVYETGPAEGARQRARPFVLCEYAHAMGNGPGALADYEELIDRYDRLHGGFVWEWRDHGLRTHTPEGIEFFGYGGDFGEKVHDGTFIMDGLVLSDGTPSPALAELAAVWVPVRLTFDGSDLVVENRRHSRGTQDLMLTWTLDADGVAVDDGSLPLPEIAPGGSARIALPAPSLAVGPGERWLIVSASLTGDEPWAEAGFVVSTAQRRVAEAVPRRVATDAAVLAAATFGSDGSLTSWRGLAVRGPQLELWRAPTENDRLAGQGSYETADPALTNGRGDPKAPSSASRWYTRGLDRLRHRILSVEESTTGRVQRVRTMAAAGGVGVDSAFTWTARADGLHLRCVVVPFGAWDCTWPRLGVRFDLPASVAEGDVSWFGTGPRESYSDSSAAARVGRFRSALDDLDVVYARPQETGHRPGLRDLQVGPLTIATVVRQGRRPGFQLSRHTAQDLSVAGHPHELPTSENVYLYLDLAQHGLGSRSCGPDVLPRHALWPQAGEFEIVLR